MPLYAVRCEYTYATTLLVTLPDKAVELFILGCVAPAFFQHEYFRCFDGTAARAVGCLLAWFLFDLRLQQLFFFFNARRGERKTSS